jgi:VanZ family protein
VATLTSRVRPPARRAAAGAGAAVHVLVVTWLSSQRQLDLPGDAFDGRDKLIHAAVWCLLGVLLALVAARPSWRGAAVAVGVAVAFGAVDELHQATVPGRDASLLDLVADLVGASIGAVVTTWYSARRWRSSAASDTTDPASPTTSSSPITSP